jgi:uncharacterized SAM-binding protein YcdF (DUF218 family)
MAGAKGLRDSRGETCGSSERGGIFLRLLFLLFFGCLCFAVYLVRHPLMRAAGNFWIVDEAPISADAIVMLGDDNYNGDRATRAAEVFKAGWSPRVVASGRYLRPFASIAELEQHDLTDRGVPANAIVLFAHHAEDTREEAGAISQLISSRGWKRIDLITSNYHTRRARYIFSRALPQGTTLRVQAARDSDFEPDSWWTTGKGIRVFGHEILGMLDALWEMRHEDARTSDS